MANRSNLPGNPTADDAHSDVVPVTGAGQLKGLEQRSLIDGPPAKIIRCGASIDSDSSRSGIKSDACHRGLSPTYCPDVWSLSHCCKTSPSTRLSRACQSFGIKSLLDEQGLGLLCRVWMIRSSIDLELPELAPAKDVPGEHAADRIFNNALRMRGSNFPHRPAPQP